MTVPANRPWWKRKRWAALAPLVVVAAYPASLAPVGYGIGRGWVSRPFADLYVAPIEGLFGPPERTAAGRALRAYAQWWLKAGERHASD